MSTRRRRRFTRERLTRGTIPFALVLPALVVIAAVLAYPLYYLVRLSFQHYGLFQLIAHHGEWVGLQNYSTILHDPLFWHVLWRTIVFTIVNVALTVGLGTLIALLLVRLGAFMRVLLTSALVLVWAMPVVVAVQVWLWLIDSQNGVLNYTLTKLGFGDFIGYDWFANTLVGFGVITALIVWMGIPFITITVFAGLSQLPGDLVEAASIDGAGAWRIFRDITFPVLKPIFVILTSLSIIWDFQVFTQPFLLRSSRPDPDYYLISIYAYERSFGVSEYGLGSAIAVVIVAIMLVLATFYIRQMVRIGEVS
jgi:N,N'-diacetylchitobiose transport system permease protein